MRAKILSLRIDVFGSGHITGAIESAVLVSLEHKAPVSFDFNGDDVNVDASKFVDEIYDDWARRRDERQRAGR